MAIERLGAQPLDVEMLATEFAGSEAALILAQIPRAVTISGEQLIIHVSGARSPVYLDCRLIPSYPEEREAVVSMFVRRVRRFIGLENVDHILGVATGGIFYATLVADRLALPSGYVGDGVTRKGGVVLIEDHSSTGGSIIEDVKTLRAQGAAVEWALCISTYNFKRVQERLAQEGVQLLALCDLPAILNACARTGSITKEEYEVAVRWYREQ